MTRQHITRSMIKAFYVAVYMGVFRNEPKARYRIERRIFKAQQKGRIVK